MNKQRITNFLKDILGIILLIYCARVGVQFLDKPGIIGIKYDYLQGDYPRILAINENSPLNKTDISASDTIIKIDDEDIKDKSLEYISKKIRGKVNTNVKLSIKHGDTIKEYTVTRIKRKIDWFPFR